MPVGTAGGRAVTPGQRSKTRRRRGAIVGYAVAAAVFLALAVYLAYTAYQVGGFWKWTGAAVSAFVALVLALATGLRDGPCPACRYENTEIPEGEFRHCHNPKCHRYLEGNGAELWLVADDAVATAPSFGAVLPEKFGWPDGCCVCGQPATRIIPVTLQITQTGRNLAASAAGLAIGRIVVRTGGGSIVTVNTPHCDAHMDGAALEDPTVGPMRILFRSHAFQQAFRKRNNVGVI